MLISFILFSSSTITLYLSSRTLINQLLRLFKHLTKSSHFAVNLLFFLLLPGIFLHEFSHILAATLLRVPTGHLSLKPELDKNQLKLGSAQIAHTDPIRLTLIGTAPFLTGSITLWLILAIGLNLNPSTLTLSSLSALTNLPTYLLLIFGYLLFAISNTMFSSPSDLQSAALPIILILIILGIFQLTHLNLPSIFITYSSNLLILLSTIFFIVLILNLILLAPIKILLRNMLH